MLVRQIETVIAIGALCYLLYQLWKPLCNSIGHWIHIILLCLRLTRQQIENREVDYAAATKAIEAATVNARQANAAIHLGSLVAHDPDLDVSTDNYVTQIEGEIHRPAGPILPFESGELEEYLAKVLKTSRIPGPQTGLVTHRD